MSHEGRVRNIERVWLLVEELNKSKGPTPPYVVISHAVNILGVTQGTAEGYLNVLFYGLKCNNDVIYVERCDDGIVSRRRKI